MRTTTVVACAVLDVTFVVLIGAVMGFYHVARIELTISKLARAIMDILPSPLGQRRLEPPIPPVNRVFGALFLTFIAFGSMMVVIWAAILLQPG